ncbi:hypothetical protein ACHAW5_003631 [Stephanodiscus triporus]|uniref:Uncharacterized protein n=1 Tax=Stephanodiscus triporus TaxID=2934178 RepID=A0ABD3NY49_9STRA
MEEDALAMAGGSSSTPSGGERREGPEGVVAVPIVRAIERQQVAEFGKRYGGRRRRGREGAEEGGGGTTAARPRGRLPGNYATRAAPRSGRGGSRGPGRIGPVAWAINDGTCVRCAKRIGIDRDKKNGRILTRRLKSGPARVEPTRSIVKYRHAGPGRASRRVRRGLGIGGEWGYDASVTCIVEERNLREEIVREIGLSGALDSTTRRLRCCRRGGRRVDERRHDCGLHEEGIGEGNAFLEVSFPTMR